MLKFAVHYNSNVIARFASETDARVYAKKLAYAEVFLTRGAAKGIIGQYTHGAPSAEFADRDRAAAE